jgi:hypothetical protein
LKVENRICKSAQIYDFTEQRTERDEWDTLNEIADVGRNRKAGQFGEAIFPPRTLSAALPAQATMFTMK